MKGRSLETNFERYWAYPISVPTAALVVVRLDARVMEKQNQLSPQEKIDRAIQRAWIAALVCGGITLVVGLIAIGGTQLVPGFNGAIVLDAVILLGLAFGVYKRSRICATLLVGYAAFNEVYMISIGMDKSPALRLIFIYFYVRGMFATFADHKQPSPEGISVTRATTQKHSFKFTIRPSGESLKAVGKESVDFSKPPGEALFERDAGNGEAEPTFALQPQKPASEEPRVAANTRFSWKSSLVTAGVLTFAAISIMTWRFAAASRHEMSLEKTRSAVALIEVFDATNKAIATGSGFFVSGWDACYKFSRHRRG